MARAFVVVLRAEVQYPRSQRSPERADLFEQRRYPSRAVGVRMTRRSTNSRPGRARGRAFGPSQRMAADKTAPPAAAPIQRADDGVLGRAGVGEEGARAASGGRGPDVIRDAIDRAATRTRSASEPRRRGRLVPSSCNPVGPAAASGVSRSAEAMTRRATPRARARQPHRAADQTDADDHQRVHEGDIRLLSR